MKWAHLGMTHSALNKRISLKASTLQTPSRVRGLRLGASSSQHETHCLPYLDLKVELNALSRSASVVFSPMTNCLKRFTISCWSFAIFILL